VCNARFHKRTSSSKLFKDGGRNVAYSGSYHIPRLCAVFFYILSLSLVFHHIVTEFLTVFSGDQIGQTLVRILINTIFSVILIYVTKSFSFIVGSRIMRVDLKQQAELVRGIFILVGVIFLVRLFFIQIMDKDYKQFAADIPSKRNVHPARGPYLRPQRQYPRKKYHHL